jgi:hypothetical protein
VQPKTAIRVLVVAQVADHLLLVGRAQDLEVTEQEAAEYYYCNAILECEQHHSTATTTTLEDAG